MKTAVERGCSNPIKTAAANTARAIDTHVSDTASEAPSNRQQDQLSSDCRPSAPPPAEEHASCHQKQQGSEDGHQDRYTSADRSTRHSDLPDGNRGVPDSDQSLKRQQGSRNDDCPRPSPVRL